MIEGQRRMLQALSFLGLCQVSMGDIREGAALFEKVIRSHPDDLDAWVHLAQARKEVESSHCRVFALHSR